MIVFMTVSPSKELPSSQRLTPGQVRELQVFLVKAINRVDSIVEPVLGETCVLIDQSISSGSAVSEWLRAKLEGIESPDCLFDLLDALVSFIVLNLNQYDHASDSFFEQYNLLTARDFNASRCSQLRRRCRCIWVPDSHPA